MIHTEWMPVPVVKSYKILFCFWGVIGLSGAFNSTQVWSVVLDPSAALDVRVVVDISGSMRKSDPANLRRPAIRVLSDMLPDGTHAGVWTFGKYVNMLVPLAKVDQSWRLNAQSQIPKINSIALYTNLVDAIDKASYGWHKAAGETERSMVLLTDGHVDVSKDAKKNEAARADILQRVLPKLKAAQVKIHSIAMSEGVDEPLLQTLSFSTDGTYRKVNNADDLLRVFVEVFDSTVRPQQVPLTDNAFLIDDNVQEFTVLAYRADESAATILLAPNGDRFSAASYPKQVRWFVHENLDLLTVQKPEPGRWSLQADLDPSSRVTVVSNLNLKVDSFPNNIFHGEKLKISIFLEEKGEVITDPKFLGLLDISFVQEYLKTDQQWSGKLTSYTDGKVRTPKNGLYGAKLSRTLLPGEHRFSVLVEGKTFSRKFQHKLSVLENVVEVTISPSESMQSQQEYVVEVKPVKSLIDTRVELVVEVVGPKQSTQIMDVELQQQQKKWQALFTPFEGPGLYTFTIAVSGQSLSGKTIDFQQGPIELQVDALEPELEQGAFANEEEITEKASLAESLDEYQDESTEQEMEEEGYDDEESSEDEAEEVAQEEDESVEFDETAESTQTGEGYQSLAVIGGFILLNTTLLALGFFFYKKMNRKINAENKTEDKKIDKLLSDIDEEGGIGTDGLGDAEVQDAEPADIADAISEDLAQLDLSKE